MSVLKAESVHKHVCVCVFNENKKRSVKNYANVCLVRCRGRVEEGAFSRWTTHRAPQDVRSYDRDRGSRVAENNWSCL